MSLSVRVITPEKVFLTSSRKNLGIKEINQEITKILS